MMFPRWQNIALLAVPVALQCLLQALLGMADVVMVTGLGDAAVAAVGLAAKLHFLLLVVMMGVASSCSILVAQFIGAKDELGAQRSMAIALFWGLLTTFPGVLAFGFSHLWVSHINPDPKVVELAVTYLWITAPAMILMQIVAVYEAGLRATGNAIAPLIMGAGAVLLNVALNYALIGGHGGFPALGVAGAAWGTLIARIVQVAVLWLWLHQKHHLFKPMSTWWAFTKDLTARRHFLKFSLPVIINHTLWAIGNSTYHIATGFAGTQALAVMGVMVPLESAFFAIFIGLSSACAVFVGQALGSQQLHNARDLYRLFNKVVIILVISMSALVWWQRTWIAHQFSTLDEATVNLLLTTLTLFSVGVWIKIQNMLRILGVLRAGGDSHYCLMVDTIVMWVFGVPIFLAAVYWGAPFIVLYGLMYLEDLLKWLPIRQRVAQGRWLNNITQDASLGLKTTAEQQNDV